MSAHDADVVFYTTTANIYPARLNLSKHHTPFWAVKRADRDESKVKSETHFQLEQFVMRKLSTIC